MRVVHLTASTFFGGPERQMLGLADAMRSTCETVFLSFSEGGRCRDFIRAARCRDHIADPLVYDTPRLIAATSELAGWLRELGAGLLMCHGYKSDLIGRWAARKVGIPVAAVSRGWTGENPKVKMYEALDKRVLRGMDAVVCVSSGQAEKVRAAGIAPDKISVIRNAARAGDFHPPTPTGRDDLMALAPTPGEFVVATLARLSPEKGVSVLIAAARQVINKFPGARFVICGEGPERESLQRRIRLENLEPAVSLCGFRRDMDRLLPNADMLVLPSFTEGLPNVVLEASAAGVPVVATFAGGTPEAVDPGQTGLLVPPGDSESLARSICDLLGDADRRADMGHAGRKFVREHFSFAAQAAQYVQLFNRLGLQVSERTRKLAA